MFRINKQLESWVNDLIENESLSKNIIAFNFGLIETSNGFEMYLNGSASYAKDDDDWACYEDFIPNKKYCKIEPLESNNWEETLAYSKIQLENIIINNSMTNNYFSKAIAITTGFDDVN